MTGIQAESPAAPAASTSRFRSWLLEGLSEQTARHQGPHGHAPRSTRATSGGA